MWKYFVVEFCVLDVSVSYGPVPFFTSILYPVIAEPPLLEGADQERSIWVGVAATAERPVGTPGAFIVGCDAGGVEVVSGIDDASFDLGLAPKLK